MIYRWHQLMFRVDELDEMIVTGLTEDEAGALDTERARIGRELTAIEAHLGAESVAGLKAAHERDQEYARQRRQMDEEAGS